MGQKKTSNNSVLADVSNLKHSAEDFKAGQQEDVNEGKAKNLPLKATKGGAQPIVTFTRKAKAGNTDVADTNQSQLAKIPCQKSDLEDDASSCASLSLTDFLTPLRSDARATPLSAQTPWQSVSSTQTTTSARPSGADQDVEVAANKGGRAYPRKLAASHKDREGAALTSHLTKMRAYYAEVDDFELAVETPVPATSQQRRNADTPEEDAVLAHQQCTTIPEAAGQCTQPQSERTSEWVAQLPEPETSDHDDEDSAGLDSSGGNCGDLVQDAAEEEASEQSIQIPMEPVPMEKARHSRGSRSRRHSSLALARKSFAGPQLRSSLLPPDRMAAAAAASGRRSSVLEQLSSRFSLSNGLTRVSQGISDAFGRLGISGRDASADGPPAHTQERTSIGDDVESRASLLPSQGIAPKRRAFSPIAESPEQAGSATPESLPAPTPAKTGDAAPMPKQETQSAFLSAPTLSKTGAAPEQETEESLPAHTPSRIGKADPVAPEQETQVSALAPSRTGNAADDAAPEEARPEERLSALLQAQLALEDAAEEATDAQPAAEVPELTAMEQLLKLCGQEVDVDALPSMEVLLGRHVDLRSVRKIGEGTFGEAFAAGDLVLKIVPMEGDTPVNGEPQKRAAEILAETAVAKTLSQLHPEPGTQAPENVTASFVRTFGVGVCRGRYAEALVDRWQAWDALNGSENDPVADFGADQMYVVFVVANGGEDLEHFQVHSFKEARSILLQTVLALAVAEAAVEFEHRDLHWGNLLIRRVPVSCRTSCRLRRVDIEVETAGVEVTLIDFTLSRLRTADGAGAFCDLSADPALFKGKRGDCQAETYRRMKRATRGDWAGFHPATNCMWVHYLADTLLKQKKLPATRAQKDALQDFRDRALACRNSNDLLLDKFLKGTWLVKGH
ncbi:probable serine/threonine-protein kinase haspin at C-terminar half [Coccomyxa sp. Obi]|nr:probable serine/threonine-protein kinase haspin at C-terminar half [Coccomyxa sp. Obi]